jgi:hypothetical protein
MLQGNPEIFAIESTIDAAFPQRSLMALGSFAIHIAGKVYGVRSPNATMLACSFDGIKRRIDQRGKHEAFFANEGAIKIVRQYVSTYFSDNEEIDAPHLAFNLEKFQSTLDSGELVLAPDGDAAFDDGSHILHFDIDEHVRIIAFKNEGDEVARLQSISEVTLDAASFYATLENWIQSFSTEWEGRLASTSI